jgi:hypothetical protein
LTAHNIISKYDWKFNEASQIELNDYRKLLQEILPALESSIPDEEMKQTITQIVTLSIEYLSSMLTKQSINRDEFELYATAVRPFIEKNLYDGAKTQIQQFHTQVQQWKKQYPDEKWECLKIAILGTHGPRIGYVLKQYFQMLRREPGFEKEVIYVEFPELKDIYSDKNKAELIGINAITSNAYQLKLGNNLMNNPAFLQEDVMSKAATDILKQMQENGELEDTL